MFPYKTPMRKKGFFRKNGHAAKRKDKKKSPNQVVEEYFSKV